MSECDCPDADHGNDLGCVVAQLEDEFDMTDSERVREAGRSVAHLRD